MCEEDYIVSSLKDGKITITGVSEAAKERLRSPGKIMFFEGQEPIPGAINYFQPAEPTCETCRFLGEKLELIEPDEQASTKETLLVGRCRRQSPTHKGHPVVSVMGAGYEWCGEHKPK